MGLRPGVQGCEWAVFHGAVDEALALLDGQAGSSALEAARLRWLRAVALGAAARYGQALALLDSVEIGSPEYSMTLSLKGSLLRQVGCHDLAEQADRSALAAASTAGSAVEAMTGLAADAVGGNAPAKAAESLDQAGQLLAQMLNSGGSEAAWWRHEIRLSWVNCEVALLQSQPDAAAVHAAKALEIAEKANAPRHVAKSLLFLAVSQSECGDVAEAESALRRSLALSISMGYAAGEWPAHAVLARLIQDSDPAQARHQYQQAAVIAEMIGDDLPEPLAGRWKSREDIAALRVT